MRRQDKYPDTKTFHYFNANPHNRITTDCVVRAIATAVIWDDSYNEVIRQAAHFWIQTGFDPFDGNLGMGKFLESIGFRKNRQPRKPDGTKYTGKEFCEQIAEGRIVANLGGNHTVAIINGRVYDTWDSTDGCIGNYWSYRL